MRIKQLLIFGVIIFHFALGGIAQSTEVKPDLHPFLNLGKNKLEFYGDTTSFNTVFKKLDSLAFLGQGDLSILHIGGSHVQGGVLQRTMRAKFDYLLPGAAGDRGFFFPYHMAQSNMPSDYKVSFTGNWEGCRCAKKSQLCDYGMSGFNATTYDSGAHIKIYLKDIHERNYRFKKVRIYYQMMEDSYTPVLDSIYGDFTQEKDSIGQFVEYQFDKTYDTLAFSIVPTQPGQTHFILRGIEYLTDEPGITYHSIGVNGASLRAFLRCEDFEKEMAYLAPDLVIFGIGINDANGPTNRFSQKKYENEYRQLIGWFRQANPNVNFIFLTNNDSYYRRRYPNQNVYKVVKAMQNLAEETNGAVWNLFEIMGGIGSIRLWEKTGLARPDKVHFTKAGYQLESDMFFEAFRNAYGAYLKRISNPIERD
ncbi:MAG: GDSL-type esterase/lipase family protein [Bacteroidota bacterium]